MFSDIRMPPTSFLIKQVANFPDFLIDFPTSPLYNALYVYINHYM